MAQDIVVELILGKMTVARILNGYSNHSCQIEL
jgi:hypothetical protein